MSERNGNMPAEWPTCRCGDAVSDELGPGASRALEDWRETKRIPARGEDALTDDDVIAKAAELAATQNCPRHAPGRVLGSVTVEFVLLPGDEDYEGIVSKLLDVVADHEGRATIPGGETRFPG